MQTADVFVLTLLFVGAEGVHVYALEALFRFFCFGHGSKRFYGESFKDVEVGDAVAVLVVGSASLCTPVHSVKIGHVIGIVGGAYKHHALHPRLLLRGIVPLVCCD